MGLLYRRVEAARVNLTLLSGAIAPNDLMAYYQAIDTTDETMADAWITLDGGDADLSELDLARVAEAKALIGAKVRALAAFRPMRSALVSERRINEPFFQFWKVLVTTDARHPSEPQFFHQLESACDWLGMDETGRTAVRAAAGAACGW